MNNKKTNDQNKSAEIYPRLNINFLKVIVIVLGLAIFVMISIIVLKVLRGDLNKNNKEGKTSWDSFSYCLMMAHNVYNQIRAVQTANDLNDIERLKHQPQVGHWRKTKGSDNTDEFSEYVPRNILYFNTLAEEVFTSEKPMDVINNASSYLADIRGTRWQRATGGGKGKNNFSSLFEGGKNGW